MDPRNINIHSINSRRKAYIHTYSRRTDCCTGEATRRGGRYRHNEGGPGMETKGETRQKGKKEERRGKKEKHHFPGDGSSSMGARVCWKIDSGTSTHALPSPSYPRQ